MSGVTLQLRRGTRTELARAALLGTLSVGEPILITDEARIAVATSSTTFSTFLKESERVGTAPSYTLDHGQVGSGSIQTNTTATSLLDSFSSGLWVSADYEVAIRCGAALHVAHISLCTDGASIDFNWTDDMRSGALLGSFDAALVSGNVNVLFTAASSSTTNVKFLVTRVAG